MIRRDTLFVALLVAGCGEAADVAPASEPTPADRPASKPRTKPSAPPVDVDALLAKWLERSDESSAAEAALLAAGQPALDRLVARLGVDEDPWRLGDLIRKFGPAAVGPLVKLLDAESADTRTYAMRLLREMAGDWAYGEQGPDVCRALMARLAAEDDASDAADALEVSRPAGRVIAREVAESWRTAEMWPRQKRVAVLLALGADAAGAAPVLWAAIDEERSAGVSGASGSRTDEALRMLAATGVADPSRLELLGKLLASADSNVRTAALGVLRSYGAAAAPLVPQIASLLHDESDGAWGLLAAMPALDDVTWRAFISAGSSEDLSQLARDPAFAQRLVKTLPSLDEVGCYAVYEALRETPGFDLSSVKPSVLRHLSPDVRRLALPGPEEAETPHRPVSKEVLDLLDDPDPGVRLAAIDRLVGRGADARVRHAAMALLASGEADLRQAAAWKLAHSQLSENDVDVMRALVGALSDPDADVRRQVAISLDGERASPEAIRALEKCLSDPEAHVRRAAASTLSEAKSLPADVRHQIVAELDPYLDADALLRVEGGPEVLAAAVLPDLAPGANPENLGMTLKIAVRLAPRVTAIRPAVVRLRDEGGDAWRKSVVEALAEIDFNAAVDPDAIARGEGSVEKKVTRLLALGPAGLRAVVLLIGSTDFRENDWKLLVDVPLRDAVIESAAATGADDDAKARRRGAAILASRLSDADALVVLTKVAPDVSARAEVVVGLVAVETRSPGAVPAALVVKMLRDFEGKRDWSALQIADRLGARMVALDPGLLSDLRKIRDEGPSSHRARCAVALWRLTGRDDEALPTLRDVLGHPERIDRQMAWTDVGDALAHIHLTADDVAAIAPTIRRAASYSAPKEMNQDVPAGPEEFVDGSLWSVVPALERCGPDAATLVPALRLVVTRWNGWTDPWELRGKSAVRVLAAIGAAAREALPELRRAAAQGGDPGGLVRDAIHRIESAPR